MNKFTYNPETGHIFKNGVRCDSYGGGFRTVKFNGKTEKAHRVAWFLAHGEWPVEIDHINRNPMDNRLSNLRICSRETNMFNTIAHRDHVHGKEKNVTFDSGKWKACWQVHIKAGAVHFHANCSHKISAILAARLLRRLLHGEFAI